MKTFPVAAFSLLLAAGAGAQTQTRAQPQSRTPASLALASPDGTILFTITGSTDGPPHFDVHRRGEAVLTPSPLGFAFSDQTRTDAMTVAEVRRSSVDRTIPLIATKAATARDHYNELVIAMRPAADAAGPAMELTARAYDDGIAFRYRIPGGTAPIAIRNERTGFHFAGDARCWGLNLGRDGSSHEGEFDPVRASAIRPHDRYDNPLLCRTPSGATDFLLAEADLVDYAGSYLRGREDGGLGVETAQALLPGELRTSIRMPAGRDVVTPWRVMLMADHAGDLISSNTIGNLNPPAQGDWRWVKPGKAAWDWWSGPYLPPLPSEPMNMPALKRLIDFAGDAGLPYMLIDEGWALNSGIAGSAPSDTDITRTRPGLNMPELVAYAKQRHVDLMLWLQWSQLDARMPEAMDQYGRWGIKGIKVDFMDRNDQPMVAYYHRVLAEAAKRKLLVDLHGAYPPTGLQRTWPNFITQEGVMGAEFNKWSTRVTARHNVSLAFTRMVLGPLDYTPGGFRNRAPADFRVVNSPPQVQTTRAAALAMYVVWESPLQMVSDSPDAYAGQPEFAFIRDVPTTWDETRFLGGDIDSHVVVARRKGRDWYVGAMNTEQSRPVTIPLDFLGRGRFTTEIWQDGARADQAVRTDRLVTMKDVVSLLLAPSGGAAVRIRPE